MTPPLDGGAGTLEISRCGERLTLLAARAAYWARTGALFIADLHLGKAAAFRHGGVPVPRGATATDLARLSALITSTGARQLFVLGDFLHAAAGRVPALERSFLQWRDAHPQVDLTLVRGNHDRHAGDPPEHWGVHVVKEPCALAPFLLCHEPVSPPSGFALCGHVHPGVVVDGRGFESARLPCFVVGKRHLVLPAFGRFTGLAVVPRRPSERIVAVAGTRLFALPPLPAP